MEKIKLFYRKHDLAEIFGSITGIYVKFCASWLIADVILTMFGLIKLLATARAQLGKGHWIVFKEISYAEEDRFSLYLRSGRWLRSSIAFLNIIMNV